MGNSCSVDKKKKDNLDATSPRNTKTPPRSNSLAQLTTAKNAGAKLRANLDLTLRGREEKKLYQFAAFSPAIAHWELANNQDASMGTTVKPYCWSFDTALLFVDISGFTNLSTRLEVDALQRHINLYFTALIDVIVAHGGDVLRFAGDAIMCSWSLSPHYTDDAKVLRLAALAACRCAIDLNKRCAIYHIPEVDATLKIHSGIGVGAVHAFRVGLPSHWEFFVAGDAVFQYAVAESCANAGDAVCSPETWEMTKSELEGTVLENGCVLLQNDEIASEHNHMKLLPIAADVMDPELKTALCAHDQLVRQRTGKSATRSRAATSVTGVPLLGTTRAQSMASMRSAESIQSEHDPMLLHGGHLAPLKAYTHKVARSAVEQDVLRDIAEQRSVVVSFALIEGIDQALLAGIDGLDSVQACMEASLKAIEARGGMLRQFIRDDKGAVVIWSYGLTQQSFVDSPERGLRTALDVISALKALGLQPKVGVTSGTAYCGLVGASYRCEYALMGPAVNLAARLMCKCEKLNVELLCNDELHDKFVGSGSDAFEFKAFDPMQVKGYTNPVSFYHPVLKDTNKRSSGVGISTYIKRKTGHKNTLDTSLHHHHHVGFDEVDVHATPNVSPNKADERNSHGNHRANSPPRMVRSLLGFKPAPRKSGHKTTNAGPRKSESNIKASPRRSHAATMLVNESKAASRGSGNNHLRSSKGKRPSNASPTPRNSEGLRQSVLSHLDQLSLSHQMILKTAAAIGVVFDRSVLINTYPGSAAEADNALSTSLSSFVVRLQGDTQHDVRFAFRSAATASVIYELMLQAQRKRLHQQIAAWYERVRVLRRREGLRTEEDLIAPLALHYLLSGDEERAKKLFVAAGRLSCAQGRYLEAVSHFDACLNLFTTRQGDDDDDVFCEVLVWLAQTIVRYAIPYKAPDFIENSEDLHHEDSHGKKITDNTNSVNCAEKLLRRAFAVLNGRIMRRVVGRFRSAKLASVLEIWKINTKLSNRRPSVEDYLTGTNLAAPPTKRLSQRFQLQRSASMAASNANTASFISNVSGYDEKQQSEVDIENLGRLTSRRLQLAKVRSQLAWVIAADPDRCHSEGEFIEKSFLEASAIQFKAGKILDASDSMNGLGCYYHKRALLASPGVTAESLKVDEKELKVDKAKAMLKQSLPSDGGRTPSDSTTTPISSSSANSTVSLYQAATCAEDTLLNKRVSSGPSDSNASRDRRGKEQGGKGTEVTLDDEEPRHNLPHSSSFITVKPKTESRVELDKAYEDDHKMIVRKALTEKDDWLELAANAYNKALALREKLHVSPALAQSFTSLARLQCDQGESVLGIEIFNAAVEQYFLTVGSHHPKAASSIEALAATYSRTKNPLMALGLRTQADAIRATQIQIEKSLGHDWNDSLPADMKSPSNNTSKHGMVFDPADEGGKGVIRNSISQSQLQMMPSPSSANATDLKEELLPWESSGVTGPQGAWAQGFRPKSLQTKRTPIAIEHLVKSPLQKKNSLESISSKNTELNDNTVTKMKPEDKVDTKQKKKNKHSEQHSETSRSKTRGESARNSKDWGSFNTSAPVLNDTATLFNTNIHNKSPIPSSSSSSNTLKISISPPLLSKKTTSHTTSKGSRRFSDAEVLSLYTQAIDSTPRPWLKAPEVEKGSTLSTETPPPPPTSPAVASTSTNKTQPNASTVLFETSPFAFCLKVVKGEMKGMAGDNLRKQLEKLYPELTYFIGPSVENSGRLVNKAAAIHSEVIAAITWALKLSDPQAAKEKLGSLVRNKCLQMDEPSEEMQVYLDQQSSSNNSRKNSNGGTSVGNVVMFNDRSRSNSGSGNGSSIIRGRSRSNSGSGSGSSRSSLSSTRPDISPDKKGTSLDVNATDLNNQDHEKLLIEKRAARALDGVLSMLALSSLGRVACLLGDAGLVPGGGGASMPLSPGKFADEVLTAVQQGLISSPINSGSSIDDHGIGAVEFPTLKRHTTAAMLDDKKLSSKSSSTSSSKFSSRSKSSRERENSNTPTLATSVSSSSVATARAFRLLNCLSCSVDVKGIIQGETPASALLALENSSLRKPPSSTSDSSPRTTSTEPNTKKDKKNRDSGGQNNLLNRSPSRTRKGKDTSTVTTIVKASSNLSLFGIPQLILHDILLAYSSTLAQGYSLSAACSSPFEEPVAMLQHVTTMTFHSIESLLPLCENSPTVTAYSVYCNLISFASGRKKLPSQELGGAALCRIECMIANSSILDNIKIWKASKVYTNQMSRNIPSSSSASRMKKKAQQSIDLDQEDKDIDVNDDTEEEDDDEDLIEDLRSLITSIVSHAINEIDINDRKHLIREFSLTGCGSAGGTGEWINEFNGESHEPDIPLHLFGCADMIKVVLNAVLGASKKEVASNLSQAAAGKTATQSNPRVAVLNVLAAALEQICAISRSARHEIVTHQRLETTSHTTTSAAYLTERVLSSASATPHQGGGEVDSRSGSMTSQRKSKMTLNHLPHSPSALSSAFSSTLDNWLLMANPYPVNCHCMVRCCELLVTQPSSSFHTNINDSDDMSLSTFATTATPPIPPPRSTNLDLKPISVADRLMLGLKCARFNVTDSKADGTYTIVVAFDKEVQPVEHLLPKPPAGTKPIDRVRAAINLPPLSSTANKNNGGHAHHHHKHQLPSTLNSLDGMSVVSKASSRRPSAILQDAIAHANAEFPPTPTVIITSPGRGQGSEMVMVLARALVDLGILDLKAVIANLAPVVDRAKLVRGTLDVLGLDKVPVGVGMTPWVQKSGAKAKSAEFNIDVKAPGYDYMLREPDEKDGQELLLSIYEAAEEFSVALLCISALTDVAEFIKTHKDLFAEKTARVVMMGGVDESSIPPKLHTPEGTMDYLLPDESAQNNQYDWDASVLVHQTCQELGIQLVVSTRVAAYASAVPAFIYDELASIGHPVALRLRSTQEKSITGLWRRASLPAGHADRRGLPDRCDRSWFAKSFCGGADLSAVSADTPSIWSQVSAFNMYDPLALLMVDDRTSQAFFEPESKIVNGMDQLIVGVEKIPVAHDPLLAQSSGSTNKGSSGIRDVKALRDFLMDASRLGLMAAMPKYKFIK